MSPALRLALRAVPSVRRVTADRDRLQLRTDELRARNSDLLQAMESMVPAQDRVTGLDYLVMLTYGRSGSTLLQGVINSAPGYLMRGENRDALHHLFLYHHVITKEAAEAGRADTPRSAWFGIDEYASAAAMTGMRELVVGTLLRPKPDTKVVGFKEIRWWHKDWREYLDFLLELFPGVRFVVNTRDHESVSKSKWWAEQKDPLKTLESYERRLTDMADLLGDRAYRVHYDDYVADHEVLRGLFDWLGEPFDRARVDAVMSLRHSH
jgi:hypothetical protein